jgi:hypothetical protein
VERNPVSRKNEDMNKIPVLPFGVAHTTLTLYRYQSDTESGTVVRFDLSRNYVLFPDGGKLSSPITMHDDWLHFAGEVKLEGHCVFPNIENPPCHFCPKPSLGCFAIEGAPVSLPLCEEHSSARWNRETLDIEF